MEGIRSLQSSRFFLRDSLLPFGRLALRSIFINYRRADSQGEAGRLFDDLTSRFSAEAVFMDVAALEPGRDFRKAIDKSVATCSILLAIIGQDWLDLTDSRGGRRLEDPNDYVRIELASALRRDIPVVPVLVQGAKMPDVEQLPNDLKELAYRNAVELTHARWRSDVQVLLQALRPYLELPEADALAAHHVGADKEPREFREEVARRQSAGNRSAVAANASTIEAQTLERVSKELAVYIGPISDVVVKRVAKRCSSLEDLFKMAAQEIETEVDRQKFLRSCRK